MTTIEQRGDLWSTMPGWGIVANLLPPEVVSARRIHAIRKRMMFVLMAVVILAVAGYGFAFWKAQGAQNSLSAEQSRTTTLQAQQHRYAAVTQIHTDVAQVNTQLGKLMSGDVDVPSLISQMSAKLPPGMVLTQVTVNLSGPSQQGAVAAGAPSLDTSGSKHVGNVSLSGSSAHIADVATFVDALGALPGVVDVTPTSNTATTDKASGSKFSIQLNLTDAVLTHGFDTGKAGK